MASGDYKSAKEAFVSNHVGGSVSEINAVTLVAPVAALLWSVLQARLSLFSPYTIKACVVDYLINCAAILFATTLYSSAPGLVNLLLLLPAVAVLAFSKFQGNRSSYARAGKSHQKLPNRADDSRDPFPAKPFVTTYRGSMLAVTCIAILAVDFKVFPRRFAKVENWGTSLMDLGVGSFVFSAGVVSAKAALKQQRTKSSKPFQARLRTATLRSLPLLLLGLLRLYSVKGLEYAEHVTEYGVHWNFFFTMAFMAPMVALFESAFGFLPSYSALALLLAVTYESLLNFTDLKGYIMTAPRTDLLSKNREGVFSFVGYLAIFLAGQATGMDILPAEVAKSASVRKSTLGKLLFWSTVWTLLFVLSTSYEYGLNLQVSRRLANLPYVLWVVAFNCCQLTLFCGVEKVYLSSVHTTQSTPKKSKGDREEASPLLHALNRNGLALFLLANLLTGLVNLSLPTLNMSDLQAMCVLIVYSVILSAVALVLDARNISIKF